MLAAAHAQEGKARRDPAGDAPARAATLREHAELLRDFKQVATLEQIDVEPPPDARRDYAGGARAARELGMNRLPVRLAKAHARAPAGPPRA